MPDDRDGEVNGSVDHNASRTTTQGIHIARSSCANGHNQEPVRSGRMAISQRPIPGAQKRMRMDDEDELAPPAKDNRMRASAMADMESLDTFLLRNLVKLHPGVLRALIDDIRFEIVAWRSQKNSLEALIREEKGAHKLKEQSEKEKYDALNKKFRALKIEMASTLANIEDYGTKKASDDIIKRVWGRLSYNIKNIVYNYFREGLQEASITLDDSECGQHEQSIFSNKRILLQRSVSRRHIWQMLFFNIFSGYGSGCPGEIGQMFTRLISKQNPRNLPSLQYLRMISRIKSALDPDLDKQADPNRDAKLKKLFQITVATFQDLVPDRMMNLFEVDMEKIFSDAWDIHIAMMASRAIFIMQWSEDGDGKNDCPYDPETMDFFDNEDTANASELTVGVVESPVLWKIGNGDGENFDSTMVLCKHCVFPGDKKDEPSKYTLDESSS